MARRVSSKKAKQLVRTYTSMYGLRNGQIIPDWLFPKLVVRKTDQCELPDFRGKFISSFSKNNEELRNEK